MNNKERFIVKDIVCDYAVYDTVFDVEDEGLICICNSARNANLIADILNTDNSKPNESVSWYDQQLAEKDKEIEYLKRKWNITKDCLKRKDEELPHHDKMLSHQICEKIREKIKEMDYGDGIASQTPSTLIAVGTRKAILEDVKKILDQIEKGEKNDKRK